MVRIYRPKDEGESDGRLPDTLDVTELVSGLFDGLDQGEPETRYDLLELPVVTGSGRTGAAWLADVLPCGCQIRLAGG